MQTRFCIAIAVVLLATASAWSQTSPLKQKILNKKLRTNLEQYINYQLSNPEAEEQVARPNEQQIESRGADNQIDGTPEAESEVHAAINPVDSNNIIICTMRNDPNNFTAPLTFPTFYTKDFGATWQQSTFNGVSATDAILGGGDPIIVFDADGKAYLCWLTMRFDLATFNFSIALRVAESEDGGATWTELDTPLDEGDLIDLFAGDFGKFVDKEWLAVDYSDSPYRNTVYASYLTLVSDSASVNYNITLRKKTPEMTRFTEESVPVNSEAYKIAQFTSIDVDSKGVVHVSFAASVDSINWAMYHTKSEDGGESFSPEKKISDFHIPRLSGDEPETNIVGIDSSRLYPCPQLVVDKSRGDTDGVLHMVWTGNGTSEKKTEGLDIYYAQSKDGGGTWSEARVLNDDGMPESHQFYPSMAVNADGKLVISWYDRRDDVANIETMYYMTYSEDGGNSFVPSFAVSSEASDFSMIGAQNAAFGIGEYTQVVASSSYGIPVWADGRTNDGNIDIYVAFVPLEEDGGTVSVSSIVKNFTLDGPFPNPARERAMINLHLEEASQTTITLLGLDGKLIRTISYPKLPTGTHNFEFNNLQTGEYILRVQTEKGYLAKPLFVR